MYRAQTYDGAGNVVGSQNGSAKHVQEVCPRVAYFHCASHELNLALSHASNLRYTTWCPTEINWDVLQVFSKAATRVQTTIVGASYGEESVNESECDIDRDLATSEDDSDSEDDEYENGEEESSDMENADIA